jgi:hypothetical protein
MNNEARRMLISPAKPGDTSSLRRLGGLVKDP